MATNIRKSAFFAVAVSLALVCACAAPARCENHIKELDILRVSMAEVGDRLPAMIKDAQGRDIRTLERVFEINTYALTTIEAYFKMLKISASAGGVNKTIVDIFNKWLQFIDRYCQKDIAYIDEALTDTKPQPIRDILEREKGYIKRLGEITMVGVTENEGRL